MTAALMPALMFASIAGGIGASVATKSPWPMLAAIPGVAMGGAMMLPSMAGAGAGAGVGAGAAATGGAAALPAAATVAGGGELAAVLKEIYKPQTPGQMFQEGLFKGAIPGITTGLAASLMKPKEPTYGGKMPGDYTLDEIRQRRQQRMQRQQQLQGAYA